MRILLTGYKGFIGSNMLTSLEEDGHEVSTFEWGERLPSILDQDLVIHVGAISSTAERDVEKVMRQNVDFSIELYEACRKYNIRFQFSSSASVYGLVSDFKETSPVDPRTPYAWSKYLVERHIARHPSSVPAQLFRYFNVHGPNEDHKDQPSPHTAFAKQAKQKGVVKVFEDSDKYCRDFIHVDNIIALHKRFFDINESGVWNFGTGHTKSFLDIAKMQNVPIETIPMPAHIAQSYQKYTCADTTKLMQTLRS